MNKKGLSEMLSNYILRTFIGRMKWSKEYRGRGLRGTNNYV